MAELMLSYAFMTEPSVLQASNEGQLTIVVSNAKAPIMLKGIDFVLREGTGARDLVNGITPTTPSLPNGWSHSSPTGGKFVLIPEKPFQITREGLIFVFDLTVNSVVGSAIIDVTEHIEVEGKQLVNRGIITVAKFSQSFKLDNFYSTTPIVNQGENVTLAWTGENLHLANYQLVYSAEDQRKVVDISANTYSYTVDNINKTSEFYLHVTAAGSLDTSFMYQSSVYPISVNPAIGEFWSSEDYAAPSASITLNWKVSDTVTSATIACPQSGVILDLNVSDLAKGQYTVTLPAISMVADYVFDVFEIDASHSEPFKVASQALCIEVSDSIPHPVSGSGNFFTDAQAKELATTSSRHINDTVIPKLTQEILERFKVFYPDLDFYLDWSNNTVNAQSFIYFDKRKKVVLFGGLARRSCLYYEGLCFIIAQCISRLFGQGPIDANGITYVGAADFYATSNVMRQVFYTITDNSDLINGISTQINTLFNGISEANKAGNPNDVANNPPIECRYAALENGIFGGSVPKCALGTR